MNKGTNMNQQVFLDAGMIQQWANIDAETLEIDALESNLEFNLEGQILEVLELEQDREKIGNPNSLGQTVMQVVWEQFINQIGVVAGEDFIRENKGLTLDLRNDAHIQTTENFASGRIANHNDNIDYQERYDDWQSKFERDENGRIKTHKTRTGKDEATLIKGARDPFDNGRPTGSVERGTDMDHTISAGEIIRDPAANAHLTKEQQIAFANSEANLNEMDSRQNRSKGDLPTKDWLNNSNRNGQKPCEIFEISKEQEQKYIEKDDEARAEYERVKAEGEQRSIEVGKQSQKAEFFRIGGKAIRAAIMGLLASLIKDVIRKLIAWIRSGKRKFSTFINYIKESINDFLSNLKNHILNAGNTLVTSIATAIVGPVVGMLKKA